MRACSYPDCGARHLARGLCRLHYNRARRVQELPPLVPRERRCAKCGRTPADVPFATLKNGRLNHYCRKCQSGKVTESRVRKRGYPVRDLLSDDEKVRRQKARKQRLALSKVGLTQEQADAMLARQGNQCAVCGSPPNGRYMKLTLDHDHETGMHREYLCYQCNLALGFAKDNPTILNALAGYLVKHGRKA